MSHENVYHYQDKRVYFKIRIVLSWFSLNVNTDLCFYRFPKSSTDGALSSVLHVQESNLSSDDFHEALFLLERSPKTRDSKRRKKSKKKEKDGKKEDVSSIL